MVRTQGNPFKVKKAKILKMAKGFRGRAKNCYSIAVRKVHKGMQYAYISRKLKKRDMRKLWVQRINAACRENGITYSRFMHGLVQQNVAINRKVLSQLAIHEPASFKALKKLADQPARRKGLGSILDLPINSPHIVHRNTPLTSHAKSK